jgi:hypothetical protein
LGPLTRFRRTYLFFLAVAGWVPALLFAWTRGGSAGAACLGATLLAGGDFLWISYSFGSLFAPGAVTGGAAGRAMAGIGLRMALLLLGLYGILHFLPGQGGAVAAGLAVPLLGVAAAGVRAAKG